MVKWHNSGIINNNIYPSPQVWNISVAIFTLYMYSIRKVIKYNCHLDTQPGDLGPFKGCYSVTSTERSFSPRSKKRLETSKHPVNGGSGIFLFELIGINRGMNEKVGQNLSPKIKHVRYRWPKCRWITVIFNLRGERDVIRLRNPTEDKKAFRRMLTSADRFILTGCSSEVLWRALKWSIERGRPLILRP